MATTLLDRVKQIMYGDAPGLMDLVTKQMYGYDSKSTATGKPPEKIDLNPKLDDHLGFTQDQGTFRAEHVAFTFGRFSVPHRGHQRLIERVIQEAGEGPHFIFVSQKTDPVRNPLPHATRMAFMECCFQNANLYEGSDVRTIFEAIKALESRGFTSATLVVGQDRQRSFTELLERYSDQYSMTIGVVAVKRSDEAPSATRMREAVIAKDFDTFVSLFPSDDKVLAEAVFHEVGNKIKPPKTLREQVQEIMNRVPTAGGERTKDIRLGLDKSLGDGTELRRRAAQKRKKQIIDNA